MLALTTALFFHLVAASVGNAPDPIATDPDKYKVILENETVRVLDYRDKPGDSTKQHYHRSFVLYVLSPFKRKLTFPDGTMKVREFKTGEVFWMDEQTHIGENVGTTDTHVLLVETKSVVKPSVSSKKKTAPPSLPSGR